uniref:Uncharacterized protein n=1 Tax=Rhodopseudomonas palustris (strain BisA53) TaxID=316055 RepID=Q07SK2_RHOP5
MRAARLAGIMVMISSDDRLCSVEMDAISAITKTALPMHILDPEFDIGDSRLDIVVTMLWIRVAELEVFDSMVVLGSIIRDDMPYGLGFVRTISLQSALSKRNAAILLGRKRTIDNGAVAIRSWPPLKL